MPSHRYRFVLIEEQTPLPVRQRWAPTRSPGQRDMTERVDPMSAILEAFLLLRRRGAGDRAWAVPLAANPLSFLLDSLGDAVFIRELGGELVYRNRAAQALEPVVRPPVPAETVALGTHVYERRCLVVERPHGSLVLEVLHSMDT